MTDTTTRRVRALVLNGVADAYGYRGHLTDEQSRDLHPEEWCSCSHHTTEHHGPNGDGRCSADGCQCCQMTCCILIVAERTGRRTHVRHGTTARSLNDIRDSHRAAEYRVSP